MHNTDPTRHGWRRRTTPVLTAAVLALCVVPLAHRLPAPRPLAALEPAPAAWRASVRIEALGTASAGATGKPRAATERTLAVGEVLSADLIAGDAADASLCNIGFIDPSPEGGATYNWRIEARVEAAGLSGTSLAISARRLAGASAGPNAEASVDLTRRVTLQPAEYHTLDFVTPAVGADDACASLMVRVAADPVPPEGSQIPLDFDVSIVHDGRPGSRTLQQRLTGRGGEPVPFRLGPLAWPAGDTHSIASRLQLVVTGTIAASVRPDGSVDVTVRAARTFSWLAGEIGGEGRQDYRSRLDETAALVLPTPKGYFRRTGRAELPTVGTSGGREVSIDLSEFFKGGETALHIRVSRVAGR